MYLRSVMLLVGLSMTHANASEIVFVHPDHLGNPIAYTNIDGEVIGREYYTPYGESLNPPTTNDAISFTGHYRDGDTGLLYMQARYYDPEIGRFLSVDPVTFSPNRPEYFNRYWYAGGNPVNNVDPDGRCYVPPVAAGCVIAGGVAVVALGIYKYNTDPDAKASLNDLGNAFAEAASEVEQVLFNENAESGSQVTDTESAKPPTTGQAGSTVRGKKQTRRYGPDGNPQTDVEYGHEGEGGNPDELHAHDWTPSEEGIGERGPQRAHDPENDPPAPRGFEE